MKECKLCGSNCRNIGSGQYKCCSCGTIFTEEDFLIAKEKAKIETAKIGTYKESRIEAEVLSNNGADLFDKTVNGVCEISTSTGRGSGYLISQNGYVITNYHVIALENGNACNQLTIRIAGENVTAKVVSMATNNTSDFCSNNDLALIKLSKVPFNAKVLEFGDYSEVRTGENVFVIGNSLGRGTCITKGIVSDRNRNGQILTDCSVNPGNSGGPIFNENGKIIGTIVASGNRSDGSDAEGMNYAIPSSVVLNFIRKANVNL